MSQGAREAVARQEDATPDAKARSRGEREVKIFSTTFLGRWRYSWGGSCGGRSGNKGEESIVS